MALRTCVAAAGKFIWGVHQPRYHVTNLRGSDFLCALGSFANGGEVWNHSNFPQDDLEEEGAGWIIEIPNAFPFLGTTYIDKGWADAAARNVDSFRLPAPAPVSMRALLGALLAAPPDSADLPRLFKLLPQPLLLALASTSTDSEDLIALATLTCPFERDRDTGLPTGLLYEPDGRGGARPVLFEPHLFEVLVNNPHLPDRYKEIMVLRPGAQGSNEIVGEYRDDAGTTHVFEYLRRNSYIPWGHYAANMAHDAIRYRVADLTPADMAGMRHLYYQRTYVRLAADLGLAVARKRATLSSGELEELRQSICRALAAPGGSDRSFYAATLWGWNYGFDASPSGYRLHASHQQIHQQYALIPARVPGLGDDETGEPTAAGYAYGNLVAHCAAEFRARTGRPFFEAYLEAIRNNERPDGRADREKSLVIWEDDQVILFVPKAQTSQWEVQIMTRGPVGNILEADSAVRAALDRAILLAPKTLAAQGVTMITAIEISKMIGKEDSDQRLIYSFLPRLPESPGAFSERQGRYIVGHYPEDFAAACRRQCKQIMAGEAWLLSEDQR